MQARSAQVMGRKGVEVFVRFLENYFTGAVRSMLFLRIMF